MPASPIRKLAPYANAAKKQGVHIYHLNIGQPDIETPKAFWTTLNDIHIETLAYSPSDGYEELREAYANFLLRQNSASPYLPSDILVTTGASEGLLYTMLTLMDETDELLLTEPTYANYIGFLKSGGIQCKAIPTTIENGFALPDFDTIEAAITPATKAILICNPSNPTGHVYGKEELDRLRDIALRHDLFIISDEVYQDFNYTGVPHYSLSNYPELLQHLILIDSVSKRFSACGARIGMVATKNQEVLSTILKFAQQRLSPPTLEQLASKAFFELPGNYFESVKTEYQARRNTLIQGLRSIPGVICHEPEGAFYCMVKLPVADTDHFCQWMLESFRYDNATVMMAPGSGFYVTEGLGKDQVRIAYVLNCEDLKRAVECLREGLKAYQTTLV